MAEQPLDMETLAAFLDNRLPEHARAEVLARLAHDSAARELLADASAALAELSTQGLLPASETALPADAAPAAPVQHAAASPAPLLGNAASAPAHARTIPARRATRWPWLALAAAASVGAVLLVRRPDTTNVATVASVLPDAAWTLALAPDAQVALQRNRWTVVRAGTLALTPTARAVRMGALAVDAALARHAPGSSADAREELATLLQPVNGSGATRQLLATATDSASLADALQLSRALVPAHAFDAGVALQLLRANGAALDASAFSALEQTVNDAALDDKRRDEARALLTQLQNAVASDNSSAARESANTLLALLAS